jgi:hypothetical protein
MQLAAAAQQASTLLQSGRRHYQIVRHVFLANIRHYCEQSQSLRACRVRQESTLRSQGRQHPQIARGVVLASSRQPQPPPQKLCARIACLELIPPLWELRQKQHASSVQQASIQHLQVLIRAHGASSAAPAAFLRKGQNPAKHAPKARGEGNGLLPQ